MPAASASRWLTRVPKCRRTTAINSDADLAQCCGQGVVAADGGDDEHPGAVMPDCSAQAFAVHGERATAQLPVRAAGGCLTGTALFPLGHAIGALCPDGVLSATAPEPSSDMALKSGYDPERAMVMSLFIAKVHGLTVAERARDQGFAAALLKRTWQVYEQLGYVLPLRLLRCRPRSPRLLHPVRLHRPRPRRALRP
ncbi:hypothetical protein [Streptomyces sp. SID2888]|uniref:hypothetical protein n=1 Tax=Streptomyces sp. SID2888 TaxID=2690256 RepID=UPI00192628B2|nr:hypothetical protein [Streptomyces sp. SID2888]